LSFETSQPLKIIMRKTMLLASAATIGVGFIAAYAKAQGVPQTVEIAKVDVQKVAASYRASKVIGSSVRDNCTNGDCKSQRATDLAGLCASDIAFIAAPSGNEREWFYVQIWRNIPIAER
jgi:hypothetical protein